MKLRRTVKPAEPAPDSEPAPEPERVDPRRQAGKGRPTPKRRETQTRPRGPVAPPPTTRREALKRTRERSAERRGTIRESARRGEDSALPARDQGPIRRLVRDIVDTRRSVASLFLPFAVLFLVGYFIDSALVQQYLTLAWTFFFLLIVVDSVQLGRRISKLVKARFPGETVKMRGLIFYGIQRSTMIRRWRFPKPTVKAGGSA